MAAPFLAVILRFSGNSLQRSDLPSGCSLSRSTLPPGTSSAVRLRGFGQPIPTLVPGLRLQRHLSGRTGEAPPRVESFGEGMREVAVCGGRGGWRQAWWWIYCRWTGAGVLAGRLRGARSIHLQP